MQKEMNNPAPSFSVVIPAYNSGGFIAGSLLSVLGQTYGNYEIIVSDDGSTDNTVEIIEAISAGYPEKRIELLKNKHIGPGAARNSGIEAAKNEWIAFLDSDDHWLPQKLQKVVEIIQKDESVNLICHNEILKKEKGDILFDYANAYNKRINSFLSLYRRNTLSPSTTVLKKRLLIKAGMFDVSLPSAQDFDLWLRIAMLPELRLEYINEALSFYFIRKGNISSNIEQRLECLIRIDKKYYWKLKETAMLPFIESLKYRGRWYAWAGLQLIRNKELKKGIPLLLKGITKWPFRFDWLIKAVKKL
jgi:glycosyltransferase involved in cell wall biosynthesis